MQTDAKNFYTIVVVFAIIATTCTSLGFFAGHYLGEEQTVTRNYELNRHHVSIVLTNEPRFKNVQISSIRDGDHVMLDGKVETLSDWHDLKKRIVEAIGKERGEYAVSSVEYPR